MHPAVCESAVRTLCLCNCFVPTANHPVNKFIFLVIHHTVCSHSYLKSVGVGGGGGGGGEGEGESLVLQTLVL